ncbi:aldo-keto reductase family 1 member B1-like [Watersipora subatra]|uniref:aldo-keto reductase family 1 member B1-like n=1 Tax=Watersipora subatra TaxID=2589382 RepID=UPI00355C1A42
MQSHERRMAYLQRSLIADAFWYTFGAGKNTKSLLYASKRAYQRVAGVPDITLNNGGQMPQIGYGTWKAKPEEVKESVKCAIDVGYRHIDCAYTYNNEKQVGEGIRAKIEDGTVTRDDMFITAKLWNTFHRADMVEEGLQASLDDLGLDYVDMYLLHWPMAFKPGRERRPKDANGKIIYDYNAPNTETWKAIEALMKTDKVRAIGLSNFRIDQFQEILDVASIKPAVYQLESHPYMRQERLSAFCQKNDIKMIAYCCVGSYDIPWRKPEDPYLLDDPKIVAIAKRLNRTPAQVVLRWNIQRGLMVIPKSVTPTRIQSNFKVFDFELGKEDVDELNSFKDNFFRVNSQALLFDHKDYPFETE